MISTDVPGVDAVDAASRRERAVERSLRTARARAQDRSGRFLSAAQDLLQESGSTDFTVQQLVERTRMSLRSFYQHFGSKDELLLVLFQEALGAAVTLWRQLSEESSDPVERMRIVVTSLYGMPTTVTHASQTRAMRALALYHLQLADQKPDDFASVLAPLNELVLEVVQDGVAQGAFRTDLAPEALAVLVVQSLVSSTILYLLNDHLMGAPLMPEELWAFLRAGLEGQSRPATTARQRPRAAAR